MERARSERLAEDPQWRRLLHFHWTALGVRGEPLPEAFFLSPRGRRNPEAELNATLAAFYQPAPAAGEPAAEQDKHAQCRFPLRLAWLRERLELRDLPSPACPGLAAWRERLDGESVSLVFADAYLNNPASMYGHTFLLVHRRGNEKPLLDVAVNFAADADTDNGVLFAVYGLGGLFPGRYSALPYYLKVQEYNNLESRDLWEYRLNLSSAAVSRLVDHLWELGDARFPYFFFNKNCSYQLLPLLEAAEPELDLVRGWPLYVIPADTLRTLLDAPGLVGRRTYRPSQVSKLLALRSRLAPGEVDAVEAASDPSKPLGDELRPPVLDAASEYLHYRIDYRRDPPRGFEERRREVHVARSALGAPSAPDPAPEPAAPEDGHETGRLSAAFGAQDGRGFAEFGVRAALHDVLDRSRGYAPGQTLEMFSLALRRELDGSRLWLESLQFVRILSLSPWDRWIRRPSWKVDAALRTARLGAHPSDSLVGQLALGTGAAFRLEAPGRHVAYALLEADGGAGGPFDGGYRLGGGASAGVLLEPAPRWRAGLEARWTDYPLGDERAEHRFHAELAFDLSKDAGLRLRWEQRRSADELSGALAWHF